MKTIINAVLFSFLMTIASASYAVEFYGESGQVREGDIIVEVLARPLGLVGVAVGGILHGVGLLFSVPGENYSETAEVLVEEPLEYTFNRPLGRFEDDRF